MKSARVSTCVFVFLLTFLIPLAKGNVCGGVLTSDSGTFDLPRSNAGHGESQCVWIVQLLSRQTISFTLNRLDSSTTSVSLYPEHDVRETVLNPTRLTSSDVGQAINFQGQTLVVILSRSDSNSSPGFAFTWDSLSSNSSDILRAVNYADSEEGSLQLRKFNPREHLTWALNLESSNFLNLKAVTQFGRCELLDPCECSYFGLYEIIEDGHLREVTRVCGRSQSVETDQLHPKLLAFLYLNSTSIETNHVELIWSTETNPEPTERDTTSTTEAELITTTESGSGVVRLECGGLINLPPAGNILQVEYKFSQEYNNNERCFWVLHDNEVEEGYQRPMMLNVTLLSHGFEFNRDGVAFMWWDNDGMGSRLLERNKSVVPIETHPRHYLSFSSDASVTGTGFSLQIGVMRYTSAIQGGNTFFSQPGVFTHTYSNPRNLDRISVVVHPPHETTYSFSVDYVEMYGSTACNVDNMKVYEIFDLGKYTEKARLCGNVDAPLSYFAKSPVLLHYSAFGTYTAAFGISWNATTTTTSF